MNQFHHRKGNKVTREQTKRLRYFKQAVKLQEKGVSLLIDAAQGNCYWTPEAYWKQKLSIDSAIQALDALRKQLEEELLEV